jgi:hypothetical protein
MKTRMHLFTGSLMTAVAASCGTVAYSVPSEKPESVTSVAVTNSIPQSIFVVPKNAEEGRDPFFPTSDRLWRVTTVKLPPRPNTPAVSLVLNGLSGTADHRLAMINGRTFAEGESNEVTTAGTRVLIRCIEIKESSVVIEVGGARRELSLRSGN